MKEKKCFKCKEVKPLSEFYKHHEMKDGYLNKCKECAKKDTLENTRKNKEYYIEYDRNRLYLPHRVKARKEYYLSHKDDELTRLHHNESNARYYENNKEKKIAHTKVSNAIRDKKLIKEPCVMCGYTKTEAHHEDYDKPLEVVWLCHKCHLKLHAEKRRA